MNDSGLTIRHKLYDFIRVADDKKLSAIYHLLENEIEQTQEWWKDKAFTHDLDLRYKALENGTDKGFTIDELKNSISKLRKKKYG
jgi:cell fate regulator YaaT (PSP1 superfamily)